VAPVTIVKIKGDLGVIEGYYSYTEVNFGDSQANI
jgi:hypothetical protein